MIFTQCRLAIPFKPLMKGDYMQVDGLEADILAMCVVLCLLFSGYMVVKMFYGK